MTPEELLSFMKEFIKDMNESGAIWDWPEETAGQLTAVKEFIENSIDMAKEE